MLPRFALRLGLLLAVLGAAPATAAPCTWQGGTDSWQTAAAWSCNAVPGPADDVTIGSGTVTLTASVQVRDLTLTGGTLDGPGDLTVNGSLAWEAGTMTGTGTTTVAASTTFSGAVAKNVGRRVVVGGGGRWTSGTLQMRDGGALINEGVFIDDAAGSHSIARVGTIATEPIVVNRGVWRVESVGTNTNVEFVNEGALLLAGAGFKVIHPGRFVNGEAGTLVGTTLLDLASGPAVSMGGTTRPGGSVPGSFSVLGPFPMTPRHVLDVDLAGTSPGDYDRLIVENGTVTVDGRLRVRVSSPTVAGGSFPILSVAGSGTLAGCYEADEVEVVEADGVTAAPYTVAVTCSATGLVLAVARISTAGEERPAAPGLALAWRSANPVRRGSAVEVAFTLPEAADVRLDVVDALGRRVAARVDGARAAGERRALLSTVGLSAGVYVVRLTAGGHSGTLRLTVVE